MAFRPGHGVHILLDSVAGTPVNISAYSDAFTFPNPTETIEVSVHGTNSKAFIPGLTGGGAPSMSGPHDVGLGTFVAALSAAHAAGSASATITYSPGGSVADRLMLGDLLRLLGHLLPDPLRLRPLQVGEHPLGVCVP